eukprot:Lithocolla_globosa_v1_NODE_7903_length_888_cov_5.363745.p2 type:complete len:217 gc:universal NODE_7903_length_888_cov_5.363745:797-147(-)
MFNFGVKSLQFFMHVGNGSVIFYSGLMDVIAGQNLLLFGHPTHLLFVSNFFHRFDVDFRVFEVPVCHFDFLFDNFICGSTFFDTFLDVRHKEQLDQQSHHTSEPSSNQKGHPDGKRFVPDFGQLSLQKNEKNIDSNRESNQHRIEDVPTLEGVFIAKDVATATKENDGGKDAGQNRRDEPSGNDQTKIGPVNRPTTRELWVLSMESQAPNNGETND